MKLLERAHASAGMGHFVIDPKRRTVEFSSWVRKNLGLNDMPIPIERLPEIIPPEDRAAFSDTISKLVEAEEDFTFELRVVSVEGDIRTQRVSGITAYEEPRQREGLIGFFGIVQEITDEKNARAELRKTRDAAQAELAARSNLLAVVSHEIRTPLGGILGIIDQLKRERSPSERERAFTLIEESCEVLLDTLDAILQQERITESSENIASIRFTPSSVAHRVAELFRPLARRKGLRIDVVATSKADAIGDPARLQQVLANFVSNGVKFTQSGGVTISVHAPTTENEDWTFVVSDTGSGMDEKRLATVFQPFSESAKDSLGRSVGAGLGLAITRDLVEALSGSVAVESELGKGSSFTIKVPLKHAPLATERSESAESAGSFLMLIERASDQVQIEAIASQFGLSASQNATEEGAKSTGIIIADAENASDVSEEDWENCKQAILIVSDSETASPNTKVPETARTKIIELTNSQIGRSLPAILGGIVNDSDG